MENKNKQVAEKIVEILQNGLTLGEDTQHFIDSTFSNPSVSELKELLQDDSNCERDSLLELLFFPDESLQLQFEPLIDGIRFQKQDEWEIRDQVCAGTLQTHFRFPDGRGELRMSVAPESMALFIARLNLTRLLDQKLSAAITRHVDRSIQTRCKVRLRNAKPITSHNQISFLQLFYEKLSVENDHFFEYLDFILSLLDELHENADMFPALMAKKRFYYRTLQKAQNMDIQLKKHNLETLLLRGKRVSYMDKADARRKIQMIDQISIAIYAKTEFIDFMPADERAVTMNSKTDIDKLMKELS